MGKQHIIELNGKRYDAVTGKMIANTANSTPKTPLQKPSRRPGNKAMDGFTLPLGSRPNNSVRSHQAQKSKTLMRGTVHKPTTEKIAAASTTPKNHTSLIQASKQISTDKLAHASRVTKSALVRRFGNDSIVPQVPNTTAAKSPPKVARLQAIATATTVKPSPLERGLANAKSHEETKTKLPRRHARIAKRLHISPRILSTGTLLLAGLLLVGFFAYQNIPNLNMRLAAARSGVHGSLPGFQPAGFALNGGIEYKPGQIVIGYKSNSDNRNFKITQSSSSWNSETLVDNFFGDASCKARCQVVEDRGKTVYLYDGSNATWVDAGIWYQVEGDSQLNSDQLLNIAASL